MGQLMYILLVIELVIFCMLVVKGDRSTYGKWKDGVTKLREKVREMAKGKTEVTSYDETLKYLKEIDWIDINHQLGLRCMKVNECGDWVIQGHEKGSESTESKDYLGSVSGCDRDQKDDLWGGSKKDVLDDNEFSEDTDGYINISELNDFMKTEEGYEESKYQLTMYNLSLRGVVNVLTESIEELGHISDKNKKESFKILAMFYGDILEEMTKVSEKKKRDRDSVEGSLNARLKEDVEYLTERKNRKLK